MLAPPATLADGGATLAGLKAGVQAERAALQARFREAADGTMVLREHRRLADRVLKEIYRLTTEGKFERPLASGDRDGGRPQ